MTFNSVTILCYTENLTSKLYKEMEVWGQQTSELSIPARTVAGLMVHSVVNPSGFGRGQVLACKLYL